MKPDLADLPGSSGPGRCRRAQAFGRRRPRGGVVPPSSNIHRFQPQQNMDIRLVQSACATQGGRPRSGCVARPLGTRPSSRRGRTSGCRRNRPTHRTPRPTVCLAAPRPLRVAPCHRRLAHPPLFGGSRVCGSTRCSSVGNVPLLHRRRAGARPGPMGSLSSALTSRPHASQSLQLDLSVTCRSVSLQQGFDVRALLLTEGWTSCPTWAQLLDHHHRKALLDRGLGD